MIDLVACGIGSLSPGWSPVSSWFRICCSDRVWCWCRRPSSWASRSTSHSTSAWTTLLQCRCCWYSSDSLECSTAWSCRSFLTALWCRRLGRCWRCIRFYVWVVRSTSQLQASRPIFDLIFRNLLAARRHSVVLTLYQLRSAIHNPNEGLCQCLVQKLNDRRSNGLYGRRRTQLVDCLGVGFVLLVCAVEGKKHQ